MPLPPNEEMFRQKVILEATHAVLKKAYEGIDKYCNSKESALEYIKRVAKEIAQEWTRLERASKEQIGDRQEVINKHLHDIKEKAKID